MLRWFPLEGRSPPPRQRVKKFNKQLFENSPLSGSAIDQDYSRDPDRLYGDLDSQSPNLAILKEKPEHRMIVYLKAQGLSNNEIAERTGYTYPWVSQITRQPWFKQRLVAEMKESGRDSIQDMLKVTAADSVQTLIELRDTSDSPAVRKAAASDLLDRYLGKPTMRVESTNSNKVTYEDVTGIDKELLKVNEELKRLSGHV